MGRGLEEEWWFGLLRRAGEIYILLMLWGRVRSLGVGVSGGQTLGYPCGVKVIDTVKTLVCSFWMNVTLPCYSIRWKMWGVAQLICSSSSNAQDTETSRRGFKCAFGVEEVARSLGRVSGDAAEKVKVAGLAPRLPASLVIFRRRAL